MKKGDLVRIGGKMHSGYTYLSQKIGIYLQEIPWNHPQYSPSFPSCEILTPQGVERIGLEKIFPL